MRILVVCGAGASSTFVAMRLRHAAHDRGISLQSSAGSEASLGVDLDSADILLVGPHLRGSLAHIEEQAAPRGVRVVLLPDDVFSDLDGSRTLSQIFPALTLTDIAPAAPSPDLPSDRKDP